MSETVTLTIDGITVTVPKGTLLIRAAEQIGTYVPRFCDHPLLDPVGACRQCIVEVEGQRKPVTSCTTPALEGMVVRTQHTSEVAADAQEGVLELLLINHPLDCPMCDKGGECPLQDQALAYGPGDSRYIDQKRRFTKPVEISPLIKLDRERCVLCARCTRFSEQISGDPFIELLERGALEQVAVYEDEPYASNFSGNVVQICPVGALTSATFRFTARPFDTTTTVSTCNRCSSGCTILVQERRGELVRVLAGSNRETQDDWICDKGRFAQAYVQTPERVTEPLVRKGDGFVPASWPEAIGIIADKIRETRDAREPAGVLAGAHLLDEDLYAVGRFARVVLGTNDVDALPAGTTGADDAVLARIAAGAPTAGFKDIDSAATIVVAGVDLHEVSPIVFLRVRKNARARGIRIVEVGPRRSRLADLGAEWIPARPGGDVAALSALSSLEGPVVLLAGDALRGDGSLAGAWNLAVDNGWTFGWVPRKANARGAVLTGCVPNLLPGGRSLLDDAGRAAVQKRWNAVPSSRPGRDAAAILRDAADTGFLLVVGSDPVADAPGALRAGTAVDAAGFVVAIDIFLTETARRADVVLPASSFIERTGTLTSWEGRRQPVRAVTPAPGIAQDDASILAEIASELGHAGFPRTRAAFRAELDELLEGRSAGAERIEIEDEPDRTPDGLVVVASPRLVDAGAMMHGSQRLMATVGDGVVELHPDDAAPLGIADGDQVRLETAYGRVTAPVRLSADVARGVVVVPAQQGALDGNDLVNTGGATSVRVGKVDG